MTVTKDQTFKPVKMSQQDKASHTNDVARQIIAAETADRERKTERLRELRLAAEAEAAEKHAAEPAPRGKKAKEGTKVLL